jgi:hypothetical protein
MKLIVGKKYYFQTDSGPPSGNLHSGILSDFRKLTRGEINRFKLPIYETCLPGDIIMKWKNIKGLLDKTDPDIEANEWCHEEDLIIYKSLSHAKNKLKKEYKREIKEAKEDIDKRIILLDKLNSII